MGWDGDEMGQAAEEGIIGLYGMDGTSRLTVPRPWLHPVTLCHGLLDLVFPFLPLGSRSTHHLSSLGVYCTHLYRGNRT
jgi:hypothetical protein